MAAALVVRVKALREMKGWSQGELSRRSGVPQSTISRLEARGTPSIDLGNLEKLGAALGVDPALLIVKSKR